MIIAVDGPAGSGKSTISKRLAEKLGFKYVDTGAIYRAITLKVIQHSVDFSNEKEICRLVESTKIELKEINGNLMVLLDGTDVTKEIRNNTVTNNIHFISDKASVRERLIKLQRDCAGGVDAVVEGRDIGTVIFPDAGKKLFLNADIEERAKRRYKEIIKQESSMELSKVIDDIKQRDHKDISRGTAPLKQAEDAILVDTTNMSIEDVLDYILKILDR